MRTEFENYVVARCSDLSKRLRRLERETKGKGAPDYYQSRQSCLDGALEMLQQCVEEQQPPPQELVTLLFESSSSPARFRLGDAIDTAGQRRVAEYYGVELSNLPKIQQAAAFEAQYDEDSTGENPSIAEVTKVAAHADVDRQTVRTWRTNEKYRALVKHNRV